ncbi:MAG: tRNA adenosine(34) deaminase TadA [Ruminococcus sp.]|uniref:tRNA adenosine(34) deaminase TadA n=1 Tax=Ruminococcus sp. TaxID=41978 RepID=UPI0025EC66AB|nr:tRNA adenosine(34) deaminase TadA [Ruminococcus sp.]MCR5601755.1 tRNA adenosine(34) deaminase TadA [Ruminococcus sp.]
MDKYMSRALELAKLAFDEGEVPVGAVVVKKTTGEIVGEGRNRRENAKNALAHAEIIAIDEACRTLGGWRLPECAIYVTLEPCPMCCGAIINSRIDNVIFGAYDLKSGSAVSVQKMFDYPYNYRPEVTGGVMEEECAAILSDFFKQLREKKSRK